jgi:hypothetical protein
MKNRRDGKLIRKDILRIGCEGMRTMKPIKDRTQWQNFSVTKALH